jgi:ankyrin repeat protein
MLKPKQEQKTEQQELDFSQTNIKAQLVGIITELIWPEFAEKILAPAIAIAAHRSTNLDLIDTDFSTVSSDTKLKATLDSFLTPEEKKFLPDLEHAKKSSQEVFTAIKEHNGIIGEAFKSELIKKLINNPDLFDQQLIEHLAKKGYCGGFREILSLYESIENEDIPGVGKNKLTVTDLLEIYTIILTWKSGKKLKEDDLAKVKEFISHLEFHQNPVNYLPAVPGEVWKTAEVKFGAEIKKTKKLASLVFICDKNSFKEKLKKLALPKVVVSIGFGKHALRVYQTANGFSCYDCNTKQWGLLHDLDKWLESKVNEYACTPRFFVIIKASSYNYAGDYISTIGLEDLLKDQDPNELIESQSLFKLAAMESSSEVLEYFLAKKPAKELKFFIDQEESAATVAALIMYEDLKVIEVLLRAGVDPNERTNVAILSCYDRVDGRFQGVKGTIEFFGSSPLEYAAIIVGSPEMINTLFKFGARLDPGMFIWNTILFDTIYAGHTEAACKLLEHDRRLVTTINKRDASQSPLMVAASCGNLPLMKKLIEMGASVHQQDRFKWTALEYAVEGDRKEAIDFLKTQGLTIDPKANGEIGPYLTFVVKVRNIRLIKEFLDDPSIDVDAKDPFGFTALSRVLFMGDLRGVEIVKLLLERGCADIDVKMLPVIGCKAREKILATAKICRGDFEHGVQLLLQVNEKPGFFNSTTFNSKFSLAQKQYPEYFEALLYKFLTCPQTFFKKFMLSDTKLSEDSFRRLLTWCKDNIHSFQHNPALLLFLAQQSCEGRYIEHEKAYDLLQRVQALDSPLWVKEQCAKLSDRLRIENAKDGTTHLCKLQNQSEVTSDQQQESFAQ